MPFLFVDYDQGAGGEYLSYILSQAPQSIPINGFKTSTGRYKVDDCFEQEFLKPIPNPQLRSAHNALYEIVPTHRHVELARSMLDNVKSLRIQNPRDEQLWKYLKNQQLTKVLLAKEPIGGMFVGQVRILARTAKNPNFLKMINHQMDNLSLILVAENIEPTDKNRQKAIEQLYIREAEPKTEYDLTIAYEQLIQDPEQVRTAMLNTFGIDVDINQLSAYKINYENRSS